MTIEELNRIHWGSTIVLQGETPEHYAIRREESQQASRLRNLIAWLETQLDATEGAS